MIVNFKLYESKKPRKLKYKVGDYVKLHDDKNFNCLSVVKILSGEGIFKNTTKADYYVLLFLTNIHNTRWKFKSEWVKVWISEKSIKRLSTKDEFEMQEELIKYNL